jgi:hypothetical protein
MAGREGWQWIVLVIGRIAMSMANMSTQAGVAFILTRRVNMINDRFGVFRDRPFPRLSTAPIL